MDVFPNNNRYILLILILITNLSSAVTGDLDRILLSVELLLTLTHQNTLFKTGKTALNLTTCSACVLTPGNRISTNRYDI